jgi:hypothetical protein
MATNYVDYDYWVYGYAEGDTRFVDGAADITAFALITADGIRVRTANGIITASATLTADATRILAGNASVTCNGT